MSQHFISLQTAKDLIGRYRENFEDIATPEYKDSLKYSSTFDAAAIKAILDQPGCVSFRAYYGMKEDESICLVFFGVDAMDNNIINSTTGGEDVIVDYGKDCPPFCPTGIEGLF
jgi:hypothetical protein